MEEVKYIPGDLVQYKQIPNKVCTIKGIISELGKPKIIEKKAPIYEAIIGDNEGLVYLNDDDILGIPITLEILKKNGWNTQNGWFYYLDVRKGFISCIDIDFQHKSGSGKLLVKLNDGSLLEIEYVHQLQHLLFGLGINHEMEV